MLHFLKMPTPLTTAMKKKLAEGKRFLTQMRTERSGQLVSWLDVYIFGHL